VTTGRTPTLQKTGRVSVRPLNGTPGLANQRPAMALRSLRNLHQGVFCVILYTLILYTLLYSVILCHTVYSVILYNLLYCILCYTLYCVILYTLLYCTLCYTLSYCILCHTVYSVILYTLSYSILCHTLSYSILCHTLSYSVILCHTVHCVCIKTGFYVSAKSLNVNNHLWIRTLPAPQLLHLAPHPPPLQRTSRQPQPLLSAKLRLQKRMFGTKGSKR